MSAARLAILMCLTLPFAPLAVIVTAETQTTAQEAARFRSMDVNNDGRITREEWRGSAQSFRVHDWNRDGVLSGDELRPGGWRNGRWEDEDFDQVTASEPTNWTAASFQNLDHNRDGRISRSEWHYNIDSFRRVDENRDNMISRAEFLGRAGYDDDRGDRFEDLDTNNNGRIERAEWHGTDDAFEWLDRNNDRMLSRSEVVGTTNAGRANNDQFNSLDYNRNGTLSPDEWHWSRRSFEARDTNRDGVLTRREFNVAGSPTNDAVRTRNDDGASRRVRVDSRTAWNDTGIFVRAGDVVTINASGTIQMSTNGNDTATPAGSSTGRRANNAPVREAPAGALLAKVGNEAPQVVGQGVAMSWPVSGQLYLGVNDDHLPDNSGEYIATVVVRPH